MALPAPSPRDQRTTALRNDAVRCAAHELVRCGTFPTLILGHVADAASLRGCGTHVAALQPKSQNRSFKAPPSHKFQTVLSPQTVPTLQSRDEAVSESVYLSDHASPPASARASGPGSSRIGRWIKAANRPSTTAAHHISV